MTDRERRAGAGDAGRGSPTRRVRLLLIVLLGFVLVARAAAQAPSGAPVEYILSFPEPARRYVQVEAHFPAPPGAPLDIVMSRTSPGRYAAHDFGKNVFDEQAADGQGRPLAVRRTALQQWSVEGHDGTVRFTYKAYGDTLDGTYLAVDETHAHMNVPATLVWARGLEDVPARVRLVPPATGNWRVATQLFPTADPYVFTAPNLAYLIDSPIEFGETALRQFTVPTTDGGAPALIRLALHDRGSEAEAERFLRDIERLVLEARAVFGELPSFEPGHYTFIADHLPWARGDGMEHRNSTVITSPAPLSTSRVELLDTVAHEFFHVWNVERIRPSSLEPFDLTETSVPAELWLAEGFTSYYGALLMHRAGLTTLDATLSAFAGVINGVQQAPARGYRSAADASQTAAYADGARPADRTALSNTFFSYYPWGMALGLGLDLALRDRTNGRSSLDDVMRALWTRFGRPQGAGPGRVERPYRMSDVVDVVADVSGDRAFAERFFAAYVTGREVPDYGSLLEKAGLRLRRSRPDAPWIGPLALGDTGSGVQVRDLPATGTPAWDAGLAQDDVILRAGEARVTSMADWHQAIAGARPGQVLALEVDRRGRRISLSITVGADPQIEIVPIERGGGSILPRHDVYRRGWLDSKIAVEAVAW